MSRVEWSGSCVTRVVIRIAYRGATPRLRQRLVAEGGHYGGRPSRVAIDYDPQACHVDRVFAAVDAWVEKHGARALAADGCSPRVHAVKISSVTGSRPDAHYVLAEILQASS